MFHSHPCASIVAIDLPIHLVVIITYTVLVTTNSNLPTEKSSLKKTSAEASEARAKLKSFIFSQFKSLIIFRVRVRIRPRSRTLIFEKKKFFLGLDEGI